MAKIFWFLGHEQYQPEVLVKHAQAAEAAGFDGVMTSEHFHPWVEDGGASGFTFGTLGAIAATTDRLALMTAVTTPLFRSHPAVTAQAAATIDRLSGGRFALGVGSGENINEAPLGTAFPGYAERSKRLSEALDIMRRLLAGEKVTFDGEFYKTVGAKLYSPPVHNLPIYVAAGGPKTAKMAGEQADGLIVSVKDVADTADKLVKPAWEAASGRTPVVVANRWTVLAADDDEAWRALGPWRGLRAPSRATASDPAELQREAEAMPRAEVLGKYTMVQAASDFTMAYAPLITELGADIVGIQAATLNPEELIKELGESVLPKLKALKQGDKL